MQKKFEEVGDSEFNRLFYSSLHAAVHGLGLVTVHYRVEGAENIPQEGRALLAFNHLHLTDILFAPAAIPDRHVTVVGRRAQIERPVIGPIFKRFNAVTIDRAKEDSSVRAMRAAKAAMRATLEEDRLMLVFGSPDTRTPGYKPGYPKRGIVSAAQDTQAPIIPAVIKGSDRLSDRRVTVKLGESVGHPTNRREHEEYIHGIWEIQTELFDSIPHPYRYADPILDLEA
jgi:1-acyl-sn-glycerol-3-phosphate acyltransferase